MKEWIYNKALPLAKRISKEGVKKIVVYVLLLIFGFIFIYPLIYMILMSLRPSEDMFNPYVYLVPSRFVLDNYRLLFEKIDMVNALGNSIYLSVVSSLLQVVSCGMMGYGLSRFNFKMKNVYLVLVIVAFIIPAQVLMIPTYLGYSEIGIIGSPLAFFVPAGLGQGLNSSIFVLIFYSFFNTIPKALDEAAQIDGASAFTIFYRIALPLATPAIVLTLIFSIVWYWNESYLTTLYIDEIKTLPMQMVSVLSSLENLANKDPNAAQMNIPIRMAASFITILPLLLFYGVLQRQFVESVDRSGITGE